MSCDARLLVWARWFDDEGLPGVAVCEQAHSHPDVDVHAGRLTREIRTTTGETSRPGFTWLESDRRTFRGDLVMCPKRIRTGAVHPQCTLPAGHQRAHAP